MQLQPRQHQNAWAFALEKSHSAVGSQTLPPPLVAQQHVCCHHRNDSARETLPRKLKARVVPAQPEVRAGAAVVGSSAVDAGERRACVVQMRQDALIYSRNAFQLQLVTWIVYQNVQRPKIRRNWHAMFNHRRDRRDRVPAKVPLQGLSVFVRPHDQFAVHVQRHLEPALGGATKA